MGKKKQPAAVTAVQTAPVALRYGSEKFCSKCSGMVNFNGCDQKGCPVVLANAQASHS